MHKRYYSRGSGQNTLGDMNALVILSLVLSLAALTGTSPFWMKLLLKHVYNPEMRFHIYNENIANDTSTSAGENIIRPGDSILYSDLPNLGIRVRKSLDEWLKYTLVIYCGEWISIDNSQFSVFQELQVNETDFFSSVSRPDDTNSTIIGRDGSLTSINSLATNLPIETSNSQSMLQSPSPLRIAIVPKIPLSEFGLPEFFGEAKLKPLVYDYEVVSGD
ncbi:hypothetical protein [Halococcus agarilyticus]|uniref:hypothetical protein n=1 Tax=Halococcus agarilyticus TaxID=1232219 RepID=UPI0012AB76D8|nr:hypothetical protein [Halococcus agarilyticus]